MFCRFFVNYEWAEYSKSGGPKQTFKILWGPWPFWPPGSDAYAGIYRRLGRHRELGNYIGRVHRHR